MAHDQHERTPLLGRSQSHDERPADEVQYVSFSEDDGENPKTWTKAKKMTNVAIIALMAIMSPLASSMFTPGLKAIADDLGATETEVVAATTGFVVMLGIGPLILAPLSETFGRRMLFLVCFSTFTLLQIPTALAPNVATLIALRTISGFFGSVGIANGGGTISDMFQASERAGVFGWYLLGPLLGPTIGPLLGGIVVQYLQWRWVFWILAIICSVNTIAGFFFLKETYAPVLLARKCKRAEAEHGGEWTFEGFDDRSLIRKLANVIQRPVKILITQPIVLTMATYQAIIFAIMYTLYTNMQKIYKGEPYNMNTVMIGCLYLGPGMGFLFAVWFVIPRIDTVFNAMTERNNGKSKPEYRLPLANIGAVLLPTSMFWFAWSVQFRAHWAVSILATFFFGIGQVSIFNTVQNYYIDAFEKYAASAIAAGAFLRSFVGGLIPLLAPALFEKLDYGWGFSVYGFVALLLSPAPLLFIKFGERIRSRFAIEL